MNLANPTALLWAALAIPIVIFYILKIRLRRAPVSTIIFWRQIFEEKQPRSIWQHLRHLLSLLLQLALLFLLVFALAEPFFRWEVSEARRLVLVIDNSASMNATDVTPSRLAKAKEEGRRLLDALRFRDEVALVAGGTQPQVLCGMTGHRQTLEDALDAVPLSDGPTRVQEAITLARRLLSDQENGQVVVLTDGCFDGADKLAEATDVRLITVGSKTGNAGITRFQVRRSLLDPIGYEILAEVVNASEEPLECRFEIELNDNVVDVLPVKIEPGAEWRHVFEKTSADGGQLRGKLTRDDAFPTDNQAWAILPRREMQRVTLVTDGNLFLEKVFEANPLVRLTVTKEIPKDIPPGAITVFHRKVPDKLPKGQVMVIEPTGSCDHWQIGDKLQNPIVTKQDKDSPLMAHVRLDNVVMPEARKLTLQGKPSILVGAVTGEPLYAAIERTEGRVLVLTVNLDQGDLPLRTAFPIMVTNALGWFAGNRGELRESLATGTVTEIELPSASNLSLWSPSGQSRPLPANVNKATIGPLDECGIWRIGEVASSGSGMVEIACNLANRRESDLRAPESTTSSEGMLVYAGFGSRPIWFYLIAAALLLATVEWYLYQRRWIS